MRKNITNRNRYTFVSRLSPVQHFIVILTIVFLAELLVMFILDAFFPKGLSIIIENFLDSIILTIISAPILWWIIVRPLKKAMATERTKYAAIVEAVVDGIISMDETGHIESFNPAAEKIFGYSLEEVLDKNIDILIASMNEGLSGDGNISTFFSNARRNINHEILGLRKDGTKFHMEFILSELQLEDRRIFTAIVRDIEQRKKAEEKIRQLSRAVEQSPSSVVITDKKGNIEYVNPKFTRLTGYSFQEVIGKNPRILKSGEKPPEDYKELWDTISSGDEWRGEFHNRKKMGTFIGNLLPFRLFST